MGCSLFLFGVFRFIILVLLIACPGYGKDPYEILGLRKNATLPEIKQAYKKLARLWHPDKTKDPSRFHEISWAYELLRDPERKSRYDRSGEGIQRDGEENNQQTERNPFANFYFGSSGQSQFQFRNAPNFFKKHDIGLRIYENSLVVSSHTKPYLIFVYADWCQSCMKAEQIWERIASELEPDGYGIATINSKMEGTLVDKLRIRHLPALFALVDGRPIHFRGGAIEAKGLLEFAHLVLPKTYVSTLTDGNYRKFLDDGWRRNKVTAILYGPDEVPNTRILVTAMKYRSLFSFGYVGTGSTVFQQLRSTYSISSTMQTLMLFNEHITKPIVTLQQDDISAASMITTLEANKYLVLPRLSSQHYFDYLCPHANGSRQFCVILLARADRKGDEVHINGFRVSVAESRREIKGARYLYLYQDRQTAFVESLAADTTTKSTNVIGDRRDIVILWRTGDQGAKVIWLHQLWSGHPETVNRSAELVLAKVEAIVRGRNSPSAREVTLGRLVDEDVSPVYKRLASKVARSWDTFLHHVGKDEFLPVISVFGTLLFMLFIGYGLNYIVDNEKKAKEEKKRRKEQGKPIEETKEYKSLIRELRAETHFGMVRLLKPGFRSIVVLVDAESKDVLVRQFGRAIWPWRKNKTLLFGYVMVEKNLDWFRQLLELALSDPDFRFKNINPRNVIGTVLSLNGFRQFFAMYHPKHAPSMVGYKGAERRRTQDSRYFLGLESTDYDTEDDLDDDDDDEEKAKREGNENAKEFLKTKTLKVDELLDGLPNWLERLFRGNVRRYYIAEWPPIR